MFCNESNIHTICPFYKNKLCSCIHTIYLNLNDSVEFVIVHEKDENDAKNIPTLHTMHLHGHSFSIVAVEQVTKAFLNMQPFSN
jgi:FtsP/CotA-like multicopper oxidase with cupredoxin domain